jgi:ATP-dependent exoDNAse (exonuclease V) alpha subunit
MSLSFSSSTRDSSISRYSSTLVFIIFFSTVNSLYFDKSSEWLNLIYKDDFKDIPNEIKELLISSHQILGATCMGLANKSLGLDLSEFDIAIIDEAGRATAPELLIPILRAKKVVLIGDHNQLPPTVDKQLFKDIEDDNIDKLTFEDKEGKEFTKLKSEVVKVKEDGEVKPEDLTNTLKDMKAKKPENIAKVSNFAKFLSDEANAEKVAEIEKIINPTQNT